MGTWEQTESTLLPLSSVSCSLFVILFFFLYRFTPRVTVLFLLILTLRIWQKVLTIFIVSLLILVFASYPPHSFTPSSLCHSHSLQSFIRFLQQHLSMYPPTRRNKALPLSFSTLIGFTSLTPSRLAQGKSASAFNKEMGSKSEMNDPMDKYTGECNTWNFCILRWNYEFWADITKTLGWSVRI